MFQFVKCEAIFNRKKKFNSPSNQVHMEEMDQMVPYTKSPSMITWTQNYFIVSLINS